VAVNVDTGKMGWHHQINPLWHTHLGQTSGAPETCTLDGHQYVLAEAGTLFRDRPHRREHGLAAAPFVAACSST
jgi:hypothetical protein